MECVQCPLGKWSSVAATGCYDCPAGTYSKGDPGGCLPCESLHFTRGAGSSTCSSCEKNQYPAWTREVLETTNASALAAIPPRCADCMGALCVNGQTAVASAGQFLAVQEDGSVKSLTCPPGYCLSGTECQDTYAASPALMVCCGQNRAPSPMCGQCAPGYTEVSGQCITCDEPNGGLITGLLVVAIVFLVFFHQLAQAQNPFTKQLFYFVQIVVLLFGPTVTMVNFLNVFNFNIYESAGAVCVVPLSPAEWFVARALVPILQLGLLFLICCAHGLIWLLVQRVPSLLRVRYLGTILPNTEKFKRSPYVRTLCVLMLSSYNAITTTTIQFFSCTQVDESTRLVTTSPSLNCDSDEYHAVRPLFITLMVGVVVGLPGGLFLFLTLAHRAGRLFTDKYRQRFGTLYEVYLPKYYYYEVVVLIRRVITIAIMQTMSEDRIVATSWCGLAGTLFLTVHFVVKPFVRPLFNAMETMSLVVLLMLTAILGAVKYPLSQSEAAGLGTLIFVPALVLALATVAFVLSKRVASSAKAEEGWQENRRSSVRTVLHWIHKETELVAVEKEPAPLRAGNGPLPLPQPAVVPESCEGEETENRL